MTSKRGCWACLACPKPAAISLRGRVCQKAGSIFVEPFGAWYVREAQGQAARRAACCAFEQRRCVLALAHFLPAWHCAGAHSYRVGACHGHFLAVQAVRTHCVCCRFELGSHWWCVRHVSIRPTRNRESKQVRIRFFVLTGVGVKGGKPSPNGAVFIRSATGS